MADVFISYKSERRPAAEHLAEILADYGYSVWWDYGLISGRDFGSQIEKELRAAKVIVVLWCSLSVDSEWVREEAALAKRLDKIIPTFIEKVDLPLGFSLSQTLDLSGWDGSPQSASLERLLRDIGAFTGQKPKANLEGLDRTERSWRRFGSPALRDFALIDALERKAPPRTLPSALAPMHRAATTPAASKGTSRALLFGGAALALLVTGFAGAGAVNWWSQTQNQIEPQENSPTDIEIAEETPTTTQPESSPESTPATTRREPAPTTRPTPREVPQISAPNAAGTWRTRYGGGETVQFDFAANGNFQDSESGRGTWTQNNDVVVLTFSSGGRWVGAFDGDQLRFRPRNLDGTFAGPELTFTRMD